MPTIEQIKRLAIRTYQEWDKDQAPRLGAALAFYTMLSLAPLLILMIAVTGLVFGEEAARGQLYGQIRDMVGRESALTIQKLVESAATPGSGIVASIIGFVTLMVGASNVAAELQFGLNQVWNRPQDADGGVFSMVKQRGMALVVVMGSGFLLLVSLAVSSAIAAAGTWFSELLPIPEFALATMNFVLGLLVITGVFAVLFRFLPSVHLEWRDVLLGAFFTSVLFSVGKQLIGIYLGKASVGSTYGAAGSLVIVLVWVYYSAQIFFFGAEFTQVYACEHGSDPLSRKDSDTKAVNTSPKPVVSLPVHRLAASGTNVDGLGERTTGIVGTVLGSALAASKVFRGVRRS